MDRRARVGELSLASWRVAGTICSGRAFGCLQSKMQLLRGYAGRAPAESSGEPWQLQAEASHGYPQDDSDKKPSKSAAFDLVGAAQSLGKAVASKAEAAKAEAAIALARAKKSVAKSTSPPGKKISASVSNTERRIEKATADAKKSVKQTREGRTRGACVKAKVRRS